jgi:hypothetical protein
VNKNCPAISVSSLLFDMGNPGKNSVKDEFPEAFLVTSKRSPIPARTSYVRER